MPFFGDPCPDCGGYPCTCDDDREKNDDEHSIGCHFPDRCLMPGMHMKYECHDVAMIEAQEAEYAPLITEDDVPF
jgi:hypothetical protein